MREDLLGYLLGALDDAEHRRIDAALGEDPELRRRLEVLRSGLKPLFTAVGSIAPPEGLGERTSEYVEAYKQQAVAYPAAAERRAWSARWHRIAPEHGGGGRNWSIADALVVAGMILVASMLFFPAIANSRYHARIAACQFNLQQIGVALTDYRDVNGGVFPEIPLSGNRAIAGIYGPMLVEEQFLENPDDLVCPASRLADSQSDWRVPRMAELDDARGRRLSSLQRAAGGSYGYSLGYVSGGRYQAPRYQGRTNYALLSDAPSLHLAGHRSDNHAGRGQNVLFEDNHIQFVTGCVAYDALFLNRDGFVSAGVDENDSVIGPSNSPPVRP